MSQENEYNESEVIEEEILEDEIEDNEEDLQEDDGLSEDKDETIAQLREKLRKQEKAIVISKKLEKQLQNKKVSKQPKTNKFDSQVDLLRFNGVTSEEIEKLKKIAVMEDMDLIDARNSEYFSIWKDKQAKAAATKQATVGSSKRGRSVTESLDKVKQRIMAGNGSAEDLKRVRSGK